MGTVKLSSVSDVSLVPHTHTHRGRGGEESKKRHTGLPDEQEEPHAPRQVEQQGHGVPRVPQQVEGGEEGAVQAALEPGRGDVLAGQQRVRGRVVRAGRATDERGREAPGEADEEEAGDEVDGRWLVRCRGGGGGVGARHGARIEKG